MPEQIGKYHVLGRIGRGGMGMVYKAHDPVLDRPVALKVISPEIEVTDELRARFFREAQACARLSHPNIVTIYDMGEHDGRLFIVMELLDGDELRGLIAQRKPLPLEDKVSVMAQICGGLDYAHQKGIVHRDVKPGNIFLLRNGQVKILDFGIAQMATTEAGLTRTGLIMGTLRYIAPEQVRGRANARSDMYSVGAVCYELLSLRPPFAGDDPIHLLEQLRTEEPTPLHGFDPSLPPELIAIVERAMRKDESMRFPDLGSMRVELEKVARGLIEEAQQVRSRLRDQVHQIQQLQAALADRLGSPSEGPPQVPVIDERSGVQALHALEREVESGIEALRAQIARAVAVAPALQHATELLEAGQFAAAVAELEAIVADVPEHVHALERLGQARAQSEAQVRRERVANLLREARTALDGGGYARCVEILDQAAEISVSSDASEEIDSLRQAARAALAAQEAARLAREQAERAREEMAEARQTAQARASRYAPALWNEAEAKAAQAQAAFTREAYAGAEQAFELASADYRRFEEAAREAELQQRRAAEQALAQVIEHRQRAQEADAPQYAGGLWGASAAKLAEGQEALSSEQHDRAASLLDDASALYRQARTEAEAGRAAKLLQEARAALDGGGYASCLDILREAAEIPLPLSVAREIDSIRQAAETALAAQEAARRARQQAERAREQMARARGTAQQQATRHASVLWDEAEAKSGEGEAAFTRNGYGEAGQAFELASVAYRRFEEAARAAELEERRAAEQALAQATQSQQAAQESDAPRYARELWEAAAAKLADSDAALSGQRHDRAAALLEEASALYRRALEAARQARQRERRRAEEAAEGAAQGRRAAAALSAPRDVPALWQEAAARSKDAEAALAQEQYAKAAEAFDAAVALYRQAEREVREARRREREQAEQGRGAMLEGRRGALAVEAATHAAPDWSEAETIAASGEASFATEAYVAAGQAFEHGAAAYRRAETLAREAMRARADAEKRREAALVARRSAAEAQATKYASEPWQAAEGVQARASAALERQAYGDAQRLFVEARQLYSTAGRAAGIAAEAEARRADAMMGDARRLLESGDAKACLRRLNALLGLRPGHEAAERLREQAERELERLAAAAREANPPLDGTAAHRRDTAAPVESDTGGVESREPIDAETAPTMIMPAPPLVTEPTPATPAKHATAAPTARADTPAAPAPAASTIAPGTREITSATTVAPVRPGASAPATGTPTASVPASAPVVSREPAPPQPPAPVEPPGTPPDRIGVVDKSFLDDDTVTIFAPPRQMPTVARPVELETSRPRPAASGPRRLVRAGVIALGSLAAAAAAIFFLWPASPPSDPPPPVASQSPTAPPGKDTRGQQTTAPQSPPAASQPKNAPDGPVVPSARQEPTQQPPVATQPPVAQRPPAAPPALAAKPSVPATAPVPPSLPPAPNRRDGTNRAGEKPAPEPPPKQTKVAAVKGDLEAAQAQRAAVDARQDAEKVQAPRFAATTFAAAQQKKTDGDALFGREEFPAARKQFEDAQSIYRQAAQEAVAMTQRRQSETEQARGAMQTARRAADQATADKYAPSLLAAGHAKERDGQTAFGRSDYDLAIRHFRDAQAEYQTAAQTAAQEAKREETRLQQVAALQTSTDQSRKEMEARRDQAVKAEADRLAKNLFDAGQTKQAEATALASRQSFAAATKAYQDATERYREAADRARIMREARAQADSAKARMISEKQRAFHNAPEFSLAEAEERQALTSYERLAYKEAADRFSSAETLYAKAKAVPTPPAPTPESPAPKPTQPPRRPPPPSF